MLFSKAADHLGWHPGGSDHRHIWASHAPAGDRAAYQSPWVRRVMAKANSHAIH